GGLRSSRSAPGPFAPPFATPKPPRLARARERLAHRLLLRLPRAPGAGPGAARQMLREADGAQATCAGALRGLRSLADRVRLARGPSAAKPVRLERDARERGAACAGGPLALADRRTSWASANARLEGVRRELSHRRPGELRAEAPASLALAPRETNHAHLTQYRRR